MLLYYPLFKTINQDCLNIIHSYIYTTTKQMNKWLLEHKKKTLCHHNKLCLTTRMCRWGCTEKKYICELYDFGNYYLNHVWLHSNNHKNSCYIKESYGQCNFITYLKIPLSLI